MPCSPGHKAESESSQRDSDQCASDKAFWRDGPHAHQELQGRVCHKKQLARGSLLTCINRLDPGSENFYRREPAPNRMPTLCGLDQLLPCNCFVDGEDSSCAKLASKSA